MEERSWDHQPIEEVENKSISFKVKVYANESCINNQTPISSVHLNISDVGVLKISPLSSLPLIDLNYINFIF